MNEESPDKRPLTDDELNKVVGGFDPFQGARDLGAAVVKFISGVLNPSTGGGSHGRKAGETPLE